MYWTCELCWFKWLLRLLFLVCLILNRQSSDCTVFFFVVGEKYSPIGFVCVPGPVQALEWSPHFHVCPSFLCQFFLWLLWDEIYIQLIRFVLNDSHRLKIGFSSCVKVVTLWRCPVLTWIPHSRPKPSGYLICPVEFSGSGASNLKLRYGLWFIVESFFFPFRCCVLKECQ